MNLIPKISRRLPPIRVMRDGREICSKTDLGRAEYKRRTNSMAERQGWRCGLCGLAMTPDTVTFDHQWGRGMGGSRRDDRIVLDGRPFNAAVHYVCNGEKGSRIVAYVVTA
jgi:hypothetical protein